MNTRLKTLLYILIFVILYAIYYWVVPIAIDINSKVPMIEKTIQSELGYNVDIKNLSLKMGLTPSIWLDAEEFRIIANDDSSPLIVTNPKIKIKLFPLLMGKIHLAYFSSDYINAKLRFDKYSRFYLGNYLIMNNSNPRFSLENSKMIIDGYKINLNDELQAKNIKLEGTYFDLLKFNSKKYVTFATNSRLTVNNRSSIINLAMDFKLPFKKNFENNDVVIDGSVTNLDLADLSPYVRKFSNNQVKRTAGTLNIEAKTQELNYRINQITLRGVVKDLLILGPDKPSTVQFNDKLTLSTVFNVSRDVLQIKKIKISAKRINAEIEGMVTKMTSSNPNIDMSVNLGPSRLEDFASLFPANKYTSKDINYIAIKKYGCFADLEGRLTIKGKSTNPSLNGEFYASNGYVTSPIPGGVPKITVRLTFTGEKLNMDIVVPTNIHEKVRIKGIVDLYGEKKSVLDVTSTSNIDLKIANSVLVPMHEIFYFEIGPLPIMDLSGTGDIKLKILGNKLKPHLIGAFNFRNASMSFHNVAMLMEKATGTLLFQDTDTHFVTKSAFIGNKPVKVDGKCSLDGVLDYDVVANGQDLGLFLEIIKNSPVLTDVQKIIEPINSASGKSDISLKLTGKVKDLNSVIFGKTIFVAGNIKLQDNNILLTKVKTPLTGLFGNIEFNNSDLNLDIYSLINKSKISIKGTIKNDIANFDFDSTSLFIADILKYLNPDEVKSFKQNPSLANTNLNFTGRYEGSVLKFDFNNLKFKGKISKNNLSGDELVLKNGDFELKDSTLYLNKIRGSFKNNMFYLSGNIKNILTKNQITNIALISDNFDLAALKDLVNYPFITDAARKNIEKFSNLQGHINLKAYIKNNVISSKIKLNDITLVYSPMNLPIKIFGGAAELKNDRLTLFKVNSLIDSMPLLVDGLITNLFKKPVFNVYINSKPSQKFIDKYINKDAVYPLKIKGDIIYSARLYGSKDAFSAKTEINLQKDSNIYYMGSTLGDLNDPIRIFLDASVAKNYIEILNFQYDKLITSQNNKEFVSPQLNAKGQIRVNKSNIFLHRFKIKTQNPTDSKIFNILFKKPMIKQGLFTSDVIIDGPITTPYIRGVLNFTGIDIPLLDTTIKDVSLNFKDEEILIKSTGEIFSNKIALTSTMQNNLNPPYTFDNIDIYLATIDVNTIIKSLNNLQIEADKHKISTPKQDIDISKIIIKDAKLTADKVLVKNISANNLLAKLSLNDNLMLSLDNFQFDIAEGNAKGNLKYNLLNSAAKLDMNITNVNANLMSEALFDLPSQIFGSLNGEVNLYCNGKSHKTCMDTLGGKGGFNVVDGRMPKLGSLEYLLKASNLLKSGVTGLSINGIIDIITPLKTGQFESIRGNFTIASGMADAIQIYSKGKDLSLFIDGTYNFSTLIADMNIYGRLSKKISTVLGPIGNASLNTLFNTIPGLNLEDANKAQFIDSINKIPGLELNDKLYRIFSVKIYGDINGENYVQSFKWVE